jgi:glycosyltransferase involved in cell wall biosynthesis
VLIGDGPIAAQLKEKYLDSPSITFLGLVDNPIRYFRCFDMGIFPSTFRGETFPLFLLECFQAELPVITTDIGEIPRIMGADPDKRPGATVDCLASRDVICRDMTRILREILADDISYENMRANAHEASKRFSLTALGDFYQQLTDEILGARKSRIQL